MALPGEGMSDDNQDIIQRYLPKIDKNPIDKGRTCFLKPGF